jgi:hypothetical protein
LAPVAEVPAKIGAADGDAAGMLADAGFASAEVTSEGSVVAEAVVVAVAVTNVVGSAVDLGVDSLEEALKIVAGLPCTAASGGVEGVGDVVAVAAVAAAAAVVAAVAAVADVEVADMDTGLVAVAAWDAACLVACWAGSGGCK